MTRAFSSYASWKGKSFTAKELPAALKGFSGSHPIGRMRRPDDLAETVAFLLTDRLSRVIGVIWDIDGGAMAGRNRYAA
jgi:NAD(P)-dependent dehydrogenase (short-subunit alcohol dehydrogenase family)